MTVCSKVLGSSAVNKLVPPAALQRQSGKPDPTVFAANQHGRHA